MSPVAVMVLISLMFLKRPLKNALFFLLGFTLVLACMGVAGVLLFHTGGSGGKGTVDAWIDVVLGALCLLAIPLALKRKPKPERSEPGEIKASRSFTIGIGAMAINSSTIVIYMSGVHVISVARLKPPGDALALVVLTAFTLLTLLVPIVGYAVFPKTAEKALSRVRAWLVKHGKLIGAGILLVFGVYLLVKGIPALV